MNRVLHLFLCFKEDEVRWAADMFRAGKGKQDFSRAVDHRSLFELKGGEKLTFQYIIPVYN